MPLYPNLSMHPKVLSNIYLFKQKKSMVCVAFVLFLLRKLLIGSGLFTRLKLLFLLGFVCTFALFFLIVSY